MSEANTDRVEDDEPDYYLDQGRVVFTAAYLARRGWCCGNGCRHCPYEGDEKHVGDLRKSAS